MISLDKCNESCNAVDDLSAKIYVPNKTKDVNLKVFNMITRINEPKTLVKDISCDCRCNFNRTTCNSVQKWNNDKCQYDCKKYRKCKNEDSWNPSTWICQNDQYLKSIVDTLLIVCHESINATDSVSTNLTNATQTNVTNTISKK